MVSFIRREWLSLLLLLAPFVALATLWNHFPARVPIHWGLEGEVNGYADKGVQLFMMPIFAVILYALLFFLPTIDPKKPQFSAPSLSALRLGMTALFVVIFGAVTYAQLAPANEFSVKWILYAVLLLFVFLGNYFGKMRPNYFIGIRTPWTLESEYVWRKTHHLAGRLWIGMSLAVMAAGWLLSDKHFAFAFFGAVLVMTVIPIVQSYRYFRQEKAGNV